MKKFEGSAHDDLTTDKDARAISRGEIFYSRPRPSALAPHCIQYLW